MVLTLQSDHIQGLIQQAEQTYPEECCGLLLGIWDAASDRRLVQEYLPMVNAWTAEVQAVMATEPGDAAVGKHNRYWIDPKALMEAQRYGRERGWIVLGIYHSHPDHPAVPSERDRRLAWSEYSYPILSVVKGRVVDVRSWRLDWQGHVHGEALLSDGIPLPSQNEW